MTSLKPTTAAAFESYARNVEARLSGRWHGKQSLLAIDNNPSAMQRVIKGEILVEPASSNNPVDLPDGLAHDWIGDVFIPHATIESVFAVLKDFDHHAGLYKDVTRSRLLRSDGDHVVGSWRIERKTEVVPVVFDIVDDTHYERVAPRKWICRAYAKNVIQVDHADQSDERALPVGEGFGFLWRLYAYWAFEETDGGVLVECRSLSLSRSVPRGLGWMVGPYIRKQPQDSLLSTLRSTREASGKRLAASVH
ncbi:MAG: hypothetical protein JO061_14405 [Acidobacteriaceae bacterium]|nr:hypothetical protein [Acidobacteriaceae bacterium]